MEFLNFAGNSGLFQIFSRLPEDEFYRGARVFKAVVAPGAPLKIINILEYSDPYI